MPVSARTPQELRETLAKVQALHDGAKTDGEREACQEAMGRIRESLKHYGRDGLKRSAEERLQNEWRKEWAATFTPGHTENPGFASALDDYLKEFFEGRPANGKRKRRNPAYPKAY